MSSSEWGKTVRISLLATWRQEIGTVAVEALWYKLSWFNPFVGVIAHVHYTHQERIPLTHD